MTEALRELGSRYELSDVQADEQGRLESLTLMSPYDYAAMDISYLAGDDVVEQIGELREEMADALLNAEERKKLKRLDGFDARFDIFHFEQIVQEDEEEDEFLDPGALLIVLERLARLCNGVGIDPQSGTVM